MKIRREYIPTEINWRLFPNILDKIISSIPESEKTESGKELFAKPRFDLYTFSQIAALESVNDFSDFLQNSNEVPHEVKIRIACIIDPKDADPYEIKLPYFFFLWSKERISISIARNTMSNALRILEEIEGLLQLEPASPPTSEIEIEERDLRRTVFIAHSFDDIGRSYAFQLIKLFSLIGFEVSTGEGYAPEKVFKKVRRRLLAQDVVVAIISNRDDLTWLIQEMTGAELADIPLIALVEEETEFKSGILGDLEFIRFPKGQISETITPILEGLRELGYSLG